MRRASVRKGTDGTIGRTQAKARNQSYEIVRDCGRRAARTAGVRRLAAAANGACAVHCNYRLDPGRTPKRTAIKLREGAQMGTSHETIRTGTRWIGCVGAVALAFGSSSAWAQSTVSYGRITAVQRVTQQNAGAQAAGTIVGGALGAGLGGGRSGSNRALGGIGGAVAGRGLARMASEQQAFQYTILVGGTRTITMVTDQAGKRVGDCVSVERGQFNNLRLVDESRCALPSRSAAPAPPSQVDLNAARACDQAKDQLLVAANDDAFDRAYRRVRLLCGE